MVIAETTTAWGMSLPLDAALERIFENRPDTTHVELSVGARPGPVSTLDRWPDVTFIGHHLLPLGERSLRPNARDRDDLIGTLIEAGITRYTAHPPHQRFVRGKTGLYQWCESWLTRLGAAGIEFAVETMYTPRNRQEQEQSGGYFLSTPGEVWDFVTWAQSIGWNQPLVLDASHLYIGWSGGTWTDDDVMNLLDYGPADEIHISENDGRRDLHRPLTFQHKVSTWLTDYTLTRFAYVVPEGKHRLENQ